jgi:hypothetical protein
MLCYRYISYVVLTCHYAIYHSEIPYKPPHSDISIPCNRSSVAETRTVSRVCSNAEERYMIVCRKLK